MTVKRITVAQIVQVIFQYLFLTKTEENEEKRRTPLTTLQLALIGATVAIVLVAVAIVVTRVLYQKHARMQRRSALQRLSVELQVARD